MFSEILVKTFIKDSENVQNASVRNKYGYVAGIIGIVSNLGLFILKVSIGILTASIAIMADAFNNLSDMASSAITMIGFKLSSKPADKEHPFGHGRLEYLSALIVAFMVMLVGFQFIKSSIERIVNPVPIKFELLPLILLIASILVKIWLSRFNKFIGNKIDSSALKAVSLDALGDVFTSSCVVVSFIAAKFTSLPIDGYVGIIVSLVILYAGFSLVKDTINPLLGEAPDEKLVKSIVESLLSYKHIIGTHDLIIHNYGVGKCIASIHAEIPSNIDVMEIHEVIDTAEREISDNLDIYLVIHMDPICLEDEEVALAKKELEEILKKNSLVKSMHDFRIVGKGTNKNLVFDIVVNPEEFSKGMTEDDLKNDITRLVKEMNPNYNCVIVVDKSFI